MRTHATLQQSFSRRIAAGFAVALLTSLFMMNATPVQAQPPLGSTIELVHFAAIPMGLDEWYVDGLVDAEDLSVVTVTLGGAAAGIGTITTDEFGYFYFDLTALAYDKITADATDGINTSSRTVTLHDWY